MSGDRQSETAPANVYGVAGAAGAWLAALRSYLVAIAVGNLVWEFAQLPLYTVWKTGSTGEIVWRARHGRRRSHRRCVLALVLGGTNWPSARPTYRRAAGLTVAFGLAYTVQRMAQRRGSQELGIFGAGVDRPRNKCRALSLVAVDRPAARRLRAGWAMRLRRSVPAENRAMMENANQRRDREQMPVAFHQPPSLEFAS